MQSFNSSCMQNWIFHFVSLNLISLCIYGLTKKKKKYLHYENCIKYCFSFSNHFFCCIVVLCSFWFHILYDLIVLMLSFFAVFFFIFIRPSACLSANFRSFYRKRFVNFFIFFIFFFRFRRISFFFDWCPIINLKQWYRLLFCLILQFFF